MCVDVYKTGDSDGPARMGSCLRLVISDSKLPSAVGFLQSAQQSSRDVTALGCGKVGRGKGAEVFLQRDCEKHEVRSCLDTEASRHTRGYGESCRSEGRNWLGRQAEGRIWA